MSGPTRKKKKKKKKRTMTVPRAYVVDVGPPVAAAPLRTYVVSCRLRYGCSYIILRRIFSADLTCDVVCRLQYIRYHYFRVIIYVSFFNLWGAKKPPPPKVPALITVAHHPRGVRVRQPGNPVPAVSLSLSHSSLKDAQGCI